MVFMASGFASRGNRRLLAAAGAVDNARERQTNEMNVR